MTVVIDKINAINGVIKELFEFVQTNEQTKEDFKEYLATMGVKEPTPSQMEKLFIPYAFERNLGEPAKSVAELFVESNTASSEDIAKSFLTAQYSIFRVEKILKNGFSLFNLVNEKEYTVLSLTKMTSFRGVIPGEFIVARIFKLNEEYFLIGIDNMLPSNRLKDAIRYAIIKIIQAPWLVYEDNPAKDKEIADDIKTMHKKFLDIFGTDEFITTNRFADTIIGVLNDEDELKNLDMEAAKKPLEEYKYFTIRELNNGFNNFLEKSIGGFSSHLELYDVGIISDEELGLYSIPFYRTFCLIFEGEKINDEKGCIEYFLKNDAISDKILRRIANKYPNFTDKINEVLGTDYTLDTLIETYKPEFLKRKIYSSTSVLFHSIVFSASINMLDEQENDEQQLSETQKNISYKNVGRNDPCPCGSGKKFKNCCMNKIQG